MGKKTIMSLRMRGSLIKNCFFVLLACVGLGLFIYLFEDTFPTASLDLRVDRSDAQRIAREYLNKCGFDVSEFTTSVVFNGNQQNFVFLEKTLGLQKANAVTKEDIPIWYWQVRFFKEAQREEFEVRVNPIGRVDGFRHTIEQQASGDSLERAAAQKIAETFLEKNDFNVAEYELLEASSKKRENRTDHSFVWKKKNSDLFWEDAELSGTGMVRLSVLVYGSSVGGFEWFLWTPELFDRYITRLSQEGEFLALNASFFYLLLYVAAIIMFILSFKENKTPFRLMVAIALILGIPYVLTVLNNLTLVKAGYDTKVNYIVYYGSELIGAMRGIVNRLVVIVIIFCGGLYISKKVFAQRVRSLEHMLTGKITPEFAAEVFAGYIFAFITLGFVTVFYYVGMKKFGVWSFPSTRYSNVLGTLFPFLAPLSMSLMAAISEEFTFRLFSVSFFKKYLKITFIAALVPSVIWAFAHSSYAVYPIYTRGIELTIVALAFCYVFIRYGILACIVAHYVIDAVLFSLPLLRSSNAYFFISGIIVILFIMIPAGVGLIKQKRITDKGELSHV